MNIRARLYDGNKAYKIFKGYMDKQCFPQLFAKCFIPMQVDSTPEVTAAITERLIQSNERVIDLLPALPDGWSEGKLDGVCARGAFSSLINFEKYLQGTLMIIAGTRDDNVHYQSFEMLVNELIKDNKLFNMMSYPIRSHGIYESENTSFHLRETMAKYWKEHL